MFQRLSLLTSLLLILSVVTITAADYPIITDQDLIRQMNNPEERLADTRPSLASDMNWSSEFYTPGFNYYIRELVEYNGSLYASGRFSAVNDLAVNGLARWDGSRWSAPLSNLERVTYRTFDGSIISMTVFNGELIAGGYFNRIDGNRIVNLASYDGSSWHDIGANFADETNEYIQIVVVYNNSLIVGGRFTSVGGKNISMLAAWDGSEYSSLNVPIEPISDTLPSFYFMASYDNKLYVSGEYISSLGGYMLCYNGSSWSVAFDESGGTPALRPTNEIWEMEEYDNKLVAYGKFKLANDLEVFTTASWDGVSWTEMGYRDYQIDELCVQNDSLIASIESNLYYWDGLDWEQIATPSVYYSLDMISYNNNIYVAGNLINAGIVHDVIGKWDGAELLPLEIKPGKGLDLTGRRLLVYDNQLICGGDFYETGLQLQHHIAAYDGTSWASLGDAMSQLPYWFITTMYEYDGKLLVSGYDNDPVMLYQWDGQNWTEYLTGGIYDRAEDITEYNGMLVMVGNVDYFDGLNYSYNIIGYDGVSKHTFGSGTLGDAMSPNSQNRVTSVEVFDNKLVIGGCFSYVDSVYMPRFAAWDGASWSDLGFPYTNWGWIYDLEVHDGYLYIAGNNLARFDGVTWELIGNVSGAVYDMYFDGPNLIVGGSFTSINGVSANNIAVYDGNSWGNFGSGIDGEVNAIHKFNDKYYFTGNFDVAGDKVSTFIAVWEGGLVTGVCCAGQNRGDVNYDLQENTDISDLLYLVDYFFAEPAGAAPKCVDEADTDGSGEVDVSDLLYLVDYFFADPAGPGPLSCP